MAEFLGTTLGRVQPGDGSPNRSETWNRVVDAVTQTDLQRRQGTTASTPWPGDVDTRIRNTEISPPSRWISKGEVLCLAADDEARMLVDDGDKSAFRNPAFKGERALVNASNEPVHFGLTAIASETVEPNYYGHFWRGGLTVARIYAQTEYRWCNFADAIWSYKTSDDPGGTYADAPFCLEPHPSGMWRVLYHDLYKRDPTERFGWGVFQYQGMQEIEMWGECTVDIPYGSSGQFAPWVQSSKDLNPAPPSFKTDSPFVCEHSFFQSAGDVTVGQKLRARWFNDLKHWEVTAAEC